MKWFAIKRTDERLDPYAICYASHTVAKTVHGGSALFTAWRLAPKGQMPVKLAVSSQLEAAQHAVEKDMRAMLGEDAGAAAESDAETALV